MPRLRPTLPPPCLPRSDEDEDDNDDVVHAPAPPPKKPAPAPAVAAKPVAAPKPAAPPAPKPVAPAPAPAPAPVLVEGEKKSEFAASDRVRAPRACAAHARVHEGEQARSVALAVVMCARGCALAETEAPLARAAESRAHQPCAAPRTPLERREEEDARRRMNGFGRKGRERDFIGASGLRRGF